uniref:Uncharacterized protein n=1 Tax=Physcomitrium patens TaxID=3218 RepID=A0A7I4ALK5_PHYPA
MSGTIQGCLISSRIEDRLNGAKRDSFIERERCVGRQVIHVDSARLLLQDPIYNFEAKAEEVVPVEEPVNYDYTRVQTSDNGISEDQTVLSDLPDADSLADFGTLNQQGPSDDQAVPLEENSGSEFASFSSVKEDNSYVYDAQKDPSPLEFADLSNTQGTGFDTQEPDFGTDDSGSDARGSADDGAVLFNESTNSPEPQFAFESSDQIVEDSLASETTVSSFDDNVTGDAP